MLNRSLYTDSQQIKVYLTYRHGNILLTVIDDGRGITHKESSNFKSIGLLGMRERAMISNGSVKILGRAGKGTTIIIKIPQRNLS